MINIETFYEVAAKSGLLTQAVFGSTKVFVDFRAPDEDVLGGLGVSRNYAIRYPANWLPMLAVGDSLEVAAQFYRVREITALRDATEMQATLSRT